MFNATKPIGMVDITHFIDGYLYSLLGYTAENASDIYPECALTQEERRHLYQYTWQDVLSHFDGCDELLYGKDIKQIVLLYEDVMQLVQVEAGTVRKLQLIKEPPYEYLTKRMVQPDPLKVDKRLAKDAFDLPEVARASYTTAHGDFYNCLKLLFERKETSDIRKAK